MYLIKVRNDSHCARYSRKNTGLGIRTVIPALTLVTPNQVT